MSHFLISNSLGDATAFNSAICDPRALDDRDARCCLLPALFSTKGVSAVPFNSAVLGLLQLYGLGFDSLSLWWRNEENNDESVPILSEEEQITICVKPSQELC
jgi:hypothetical protein